MNLIQLKKLEPWQWPPDAGDVLKKILRNRRAPVADRAEAAELAGDLIVMDDEMAGLLTDILRDSREPEKVRATAAIALGPVLEQTDTTGFDDPYEEAPVSEEAFEKMQNALREVHYDERAPKEVRRRALEGAVRSPQDWQKDAIRAAYSSSDREWKLTAVFCMQYVRGFKREVLEMLKSPDAEIHYEAVRAAGNSELEEAWPHIASLLQSRKTDKDLLLAAIEAAPWIRPREAVELLSELESKDEDIVEAVSEAIAMAEGSLENFDDDEDGEDEDEDVEDEDPRR